MAFPTDDATLTDAARLLFVRTKQLREGAQRLIDQCDAGGLRLSDTLNWFASVLGPAKIEFTALVARPGLGAELQRHKPSVFATTAAADTAVADVRAALDSMILFIEANFPVDGQRRCLSLTLSNDGSGILTQRTITAGAALTNFRAALVTFRDAFLP